MKSISKITVMLAVVFGVLGAFHDARAQQQPPVKLSLAHAYVLTRGISPGAYVSVSARVNPLGNPAVQAVYVHHKNADGTWTDVRMEEPAPRLNHGCRMFKKDFKVSWLEFVIKYVTSEGIFWDNNNGANYKITSNFTVARGWRFSDFSGAAKVSLAMAIGDDGRNAYATIFARNLGHDKEVGIRYTRDNWAHAGEYAASYMGPYKNLEGNIEQWVVMFPRVPAGTTMEFAVFCKDLQTGEVFWDNNFGRNYRLNSTYWAVY